MRILLDGNIYNKIEPDSSLIKKLNGLIKLEKVTIICNRVVERELIESPYGGIPNWFPVKTINEPGAFIGYAIIAPNNVDPNDERYSKIMPDVSTYSEHRGISNNSSDAIIADTVLRTCDYVVSEDNRLRRRLSLTPFKTSCKGITYAEFKSILDNQFA